MLSLSEDEPQTFITVVAWLFVVIGAYLALQAFQQLVIWTFFFPIDPPAIGLSVLSAVALLFDTGAVLCGVGMLNRRAKALRNSVALLWTYVVYVVGGVVWGIAEQLMEWAESSARSAEAADYQVLSDRYDMALTTSSYVQTIVLLVVCIWLARRLSTPLIRKIYATY